MRHWILAFICLCPFFSKGQIKIVKDGFPCARIIVDKQDSIDLKAALILQDFTERMSGAKLEILDKGSCLKSGDILIGPFQLPIEGVDINQIKEDGFYLSSSGSYLHIVGNEGKGTIYGVISLLEDYFGIHYYAENSCTINKHRDMVVPSGIKRLDNPAFKYRQTSTYSLSDPLYKLWHRLESPSDIFAGGLWVHTFNRILPASEFGEKHPEYYSFINGMRRPGDASQWCLTNPDVFETVAHRIDSIFRKYPDKKTISISQNDSQNHCFCDACQEIDNREGSPSGSIIYFLNKLAERFPDKEFSTLAYLYSVMPPKNIKPLPNVNIMLCDIDCYREVTIPENNSGRKFLEALEGWSKISDNIFVWDYGTNFDNYISPFPNFHILQPNMVLFHKNNATMHFSQINSVKGGNFSELRSYLVAKLMWNPYIDVDSLIRSFLNGYYGDAASFLYQYIKIQEGALLGSNIPLWIYDTPITHKTGMLNPQLMKRYQELFDHAESAVKNDTLLLNRVREARLPIMYAGLEIARTNPIEDPAPLFDKLELFRQRAAKLGVMIFNERYNTIEEYCTLYAQRNLAQQKTNVAKGAPVKFISKPDAPYDKIADKALTDGLYGGASYNESWVGWEGRDGEFIIDLGKKKGIEEVEVDFLHSLGAWILLPKSITCYTSVDNKHYTMLGRKDIGESRDREVKFVNIKVASDEKMEARYVKIKVATIGLCPPWHYGVGHPAWFFIDEVLVR